MTEMTEVVKCVIETLAALLPGETFSVEDDCITAYNSAVTMEPKVIGEINGWSVVIWKYYSATNDSPDYVSDCEVGEFTHYGPAVQKFVETIFQVKSQQYWDQMADLAMCNEWDERHG